MLKRAFPSLAGLAKSQNVVFTSNPSSFEVNGINFLGTSGENVMDLMAYSDCPSGIEALKSTLLINHIAPTCPDTL